MAVVVTWSSCSTTTLTIRIQIPIKSRYSFFLKRKKINEKGSGWEIFLKRNSLDGSNHALKYLPYVVVVTSAKSKELYNIDPRSNQMIKFRSLIYDSSIAALN